MNVHDYIKAAAVATMIALAIITVKHERKHPLLVTRVSEIVVMKAHAEEAPVQKVIVKARHKVIEEDHARPVRVAEAVERPTLRERVERLKEKIVIPHRDPPSRTRTVDGSDAKWTFPYSCSKVKWYADHFSQETLEKMRVMAGEPAPTGEQRQQISECIAGRFQ